MLHVERPPIGQQGHQHQHQHTRQEVGERLEVLCNRLQTFEDQAAVDRARNLQASYVGSRVELRSAPVSANFQEMHGACQHQRLCLFQQLFSLNCHLLYLVAL